MSLIIQFIIRYLYIALMFCAMFAMIIVSEVCYAFFKAVVLKQVKGFTLKESHAVTALMPFNKRISFTHYANKRCVLVFSSIAFALVFTIFASTPNGIGVPLIDNGGDLIQIFYVIVLSIGMGIYSIASLNEKNGFVMVSRLFARLSLLLLPAFACFASVAAYLQAIGIIGDTFSLAIITKSTPYNSMDSLGIAGLILFLFVVFSQIQGGKTFAETDCLLLKQSQLKGFDGMPRAFLNLWSLFLPYIIMIIFVYVYFPWEYFNTLFDGARKTMLMGLFAFFAFWSLVIFSRTIAVTICWYIMSQLKKHLGKYSVFLVPAITIVAMVLIYLDSIRISESVIAF